MSVTIMNDTIHPGLAALKRLFPDDQHRYTIIGELIAAKKAGHAFYNEGDVDRLLHWYLGDVPNGVCVPIRMWLETL